MTHLKRKLHSCLLASSCLCFIALAPSFSHASNNCNEEERDLNPRTTSSLSSSSKKLTVDHNFFTERQEEEFKEKCRDLDEKIINNRLIAIHDNIRPIVNIIKDEKSFEYLLSDILLKLIPFEQDKIPGLIQTVSNEALKLITDDMSQFTKLNIILELIKIDQNDIEPRVNAVLENVDKLLITKDMKGIVKHFLSMDLLKKKAESIPNYVKVISDNIYGFLPESPDEYPGGRTIRRFIVNLLRSNLEKLEKSMVAIPKNINKLISENKCDDHRADIIKSFYGVDCQWQNKSAPNSNGKVHH